MRQGSSLDDLFMSLVDEVSNLVFARLRDELVAAVNAEMNKNYALTLKILADLQESSTTSVAAFAEIAKCLENLKERVETLERGF